MCYACGPGRILSEPVRCRQPAFRWSTTRLTMQKSDNLMKSARALVIPAVGPKLRAEIFQDTSVRMVQVTGAGLDRLDLPLLKRSGIAVANVPGGSNSALAEYAVTTASVLLRRFAWADKEIRAGNYQAVRARAVADNLSGLEGLLVGVVGLGMIGLAVAQAFYRAGCRICYFRSCAA